MIPGPSNPKHTNKHPERSPAFTTTCHPTDECAICTIYADHFDLTSLLTRLDHTDPYTQGLQQGIALRTHDVDSQASRYRSQLAASHLKLQNFQSESTVRQLEIQTLRTLATRYAMEIELLKRELAMQQDRAMALETTCDELQVELADERRKALTDESLDPQGTEVEDWVWNWDDDWEKYERENLDDSYTQNASRDISLNPNFASSSINNRLDDERSRSVSDSPSNEDWGWVYDVPLSSVDTASGFYWADYGESPTMDRAPSGSNWGGRALETMGDIHNKPIHSNQEVAHDSRSQASTPEVFHDQDNMGISTELTLKEIVDLIAIASSATEQSRSDKLTSAAALNRIRALIQHAERIPRDQRSEAQAWLLTNWWKPSLTIVPVNVQPKPPSHPTLDLPAIPEIYVDASESGVGVYFPLSDSSTRPNPWQWLAYRWLEKRHPSKLIGPNGKVVIVWAELIAVEMGLHVLRAFGYGHDAQTGGKSVRVVGDDVFLDPQEDEHILNAHSGQRTPVVVRSDNLGVVRALSWLSSPNQTELNAPHTKLWPRIEVLNTIANRILRTSGLYNLDLSVRWVRSKENLADGPSRASPSGIWNPLLGKGGDMKKPTEIREEMVDWDILQSRASVSERIPAHLNRCLKPVGGDL